MLHSTNFGTPTSETYMDKEALLLLPLGFQSGCSLPKAARQMYKEVQGCVCGGGKQQKFCPHLLKELRSSVARPLELERRSEGREGAEGRPFTAHLRRCFYRVHQCLSLCETAFGVLCAFYLRYAAQLLWYSHRNEEQLTNNLLLPRGFSPAGS